MRHLAAVLMLASAAAPAIADTVVYDTLGITDNHTYNRSIGCAIGVPPNTTDVYDLQVVDDFVLDWMTTPTSSASFQLTRVTADFCSTIPVTDPPIPHNIAAVWVQVFANVIDANLTEHPSDTPTGDFIAPLSAVTLTDLGVLPGMPSIANNGVRVAVDLSSQHIVLTPGRWWISVQPAAVEVPEWFYMPRQLDTNVVGMDNYFRNGGVHHVDPTFGGGLNVLNSPQFDNFFKMGDAGFHVGTVPMQIRATAACPADFDHSGTLSVQDIFGFLAAWFAGNPAADFNGGGLAVNDIFDFLTAWFAGC